MRIGHRPACFLSWLIVAVVCVSTPGSSSAQSDPNEEAMRHARSLSLAFRRAAEQVKPSVVTVISKYPRQSLRELLGDPRLRRLLPNQPPFEPEGEDPDGQPGDGALGDLLPEQFATNVGSGVVIDSAGVILTNNHVVQGADEVVIRLSDGSEETAVEILTDPFSDLAIVRIQSEQPLEAAALGDSEGVAIGDWVIAIGSPFELEATVSAGIISAKGRSIPRIPRSRLLQTDAAINPGNSGGPLVSLEGRVVGINTAIATNNGGYQGVGFAIPVNQAKWISTELLERGQVRRAYLGIRIGELTAEAAREFQLRARSGVWVLEVYPETPAKGAGLETDDVIVNFAGIPVRAPGDLQSAVEQQPIGSSQKMEVVRKGDRVTLNVTVAALPTRLTPALPSEDDEE